MTDRKITNLPASIRQRLLQVARDSARPFQEVLQYYAMERFLYRLSVSPHSEKFVLKGALMLVAWGVSSSRPTRDIDLLGFLPNNVDMLVALIREVCDQQVDADALTFDSTTVVGKVTKEDADYTGVRVAFRGSLQNMPIPMQIDVGFGDIVFPPATVAEYPTILNHPPPQLRGYRRETTIAEKFEAMVKLGLLNSRMKDFFDIWILSRQFDFDGVVLTEAIQKTFANRGTPISVEPTAFTRSFVTDAGKAAQWQAFLRKLRIAEVAPDLASVCQAIAAFLSPPSTALISEQPFRQVWRNGGPWTATAEKRG